MIDELLDIRRELSQDQYRLLGYGTARRVFDLNNGYVVKVAKNVKGIAQNRVEYHISTESQLPIIARSINISEDNRYLIMEKAERLNDFSYVFWYYDVDNLYELLNSDDFKELIEDYHVTRGDLGRISSWGSVDGRPVIIDYGITQAVKRRYYWF